MRHTVSRLFISIDCSLDMPQGIFVEPAMVIPLTEFAGRDGHEINPQRVGDRIANGSFEDPLPHGAVVGRRDDEFPVRRETLDGEFY